jgi:hypothetical protein
MPESAVKRLAEGYRSGDPVLMALLKDLGVIGIVPHDEGPLARWENEGGSTEPATPAEI